MKTLDELKSLGGTFSIGQALSEAWTLISQKLGFFVLTIFLLPIAFLLIAITIIGIPFLYFGVMPCLGACFIYVLWNIQTGRGWNNYSDFFSGFRFYKSLIVSFLIYLLISLIMNSFNLKENMQIYTLAYETMIKNRGDMSAMQDYIEGVNQIQQNSNHFLNFIVTLVSSLIALLLVFRSHFAVVYQLNGIDSLVTSGKVMLKQYNIFKMLGLFIVLIVFNIVGLIPLGLGLLFTLPLSIAALYSAFSQITQCDMIEEESNTDGSILSSFENA